MTFDKIIFGAGLYGLYAALQCGRRGQRVLVLERDAAPFMRATYINQARVHMGYHYPRSYSTAVKSAHYFERFHADYGFCEHTSFEQIYATGAHYSWTNAAEFRSFCRAAGILCEDVPVEKYFNPGMCDGAFRTREYTTDAQVLKQYFLEQLEPLKNVALRCGERPVSVEKAGGAWHVRTSKGEDINAPFILNATAGVNKGSYVKCWASSRSASSTNCARSSCVRWKKALPAWASPSWTGRFFPLCRLAKQVCTV